VDVDRINQLRALALMFIDGQGRTRREAGLMEQIVDEEFPDDEEMQDFVTDLARFTPGGGVHLLDEDDIARVCRGILRRLDELAV
jgi:hypothetical protein